MLCRVLITSFCILAISACQAEESAPILPGAYSTDEYLGFLEGKRVAVVANQTSLIGNVQLVDSLISLGIHVSKIFTPEHGFSGNADNGAFVSNDFYSEDSIPVISLHGRSKKPYAADLKNIDIILFDLQDIGVRVYTYISTLHYMMEACAVHNIPLLVLDRPNPNGHYVSGPTLKAEFRSFVGMHPIPLVYGMTIGEFALMINGEGWLNNSVQCHLRVIRCENYDHTLFYELPVNPSPNLQSMRAVYLYPSLVLFERTVVSVGRGTNMPFTIYGHPNYPDKEFSFTPVSMEGSSSFPKLENKKCFGVDLRELSLDSIRNQKLNFNYLLKMYADLDMGEEFFTLNFDKLAGSDALRKQILEGWSFETIQRSWKEDLDAYKKIRIKYLLYPDFE